MRVWTTKDFEGRWPVPVSAVVVSDTEENAKAELRHVLRLHDLPGDKFTLQELDLSERDVLILSDGEY